MESATSSPFIKAFWRVFHGKVVSNRVARTLWKHRRIMSEMVIGQCFWGVSALHFLVAFPYKTFNPVSVVI